MNKMKKLLSSLLALSVVLSYVPMPAVAEEVCTHHVHDDKCGYVQAVEGKSCTHQCTESCPKKDVTVCVHDHVKLGCAHTPAVEGVACDHVHGEGCGYVPAQAAVPCTCGAVAAHTAQCASLVTEGAECDCGMPTLHAEGCEPKAAVAEQCSHVHGACAYKAAVQESWGCGHVCTKDSGCVKAVCAHAHDASCGYVQAVKGSDCTFVCTECKAEEKTCTCESTDPGEHAPFCDLYVRTYEECKCVLDCAVEGLNDYCETCYFEGAEACTGGEEEQIAYATSGIIGSLSWKLDDNGVLTISGSGSVGSDDFSGIASYIKSVTIEDGVTSIDAYAFRGCSNLTSVTIPGSVKTIGSSAFSGCTSLKSVSIPGSVVSIGSSAFSGCTSLESVSILGSVTTIGNFAFSGCTNLTTVEYWGKSEPKDGKNVFGGCNRLEVIKVHKDYEGGKIAGINVSKELGNSSTPDDTNTYTIKATANPTEGGIVTGDGTYTKGASVTVTATAASGYRFTGWMEDGKVVSNVASYTFPATANRNLTAVFEAHVHNWTYAVEGATITATCSNADGCTNPNGGSVTIQAPTDLVYSGTEKNATLVGTIAGADTVEITYTGDHKSAGDHTASITVGGVTASVNFAIAPATPVLSWEDQSVSYASSIPAPAVTLENGETFNGTITYTYNDGKAGLPTDAGTYTVTASIAAAGNYTAASKTIQLTITKATPTIEVPTATGITYGQTLTASTLSLDGWSWVDASVMPSQSAAFEAVRTVDDSNYDYSNVEGYDAAAHTVKRSITVEVAKATPEISLQVEGTSFYPGNAVTVTSTIGNPHNAALSDLPEVALTWQIAGSEAQTITGNSFTIPAGLTEGDVITITATTTGNDCYTTSNATATVTISQKIVLTIDGVTAESGTYNGSAHKGYTGTPAAEGYTGTFEVTYAGVNGTVYGPTAEAPVNAGNYSVTFAIPGTDPMFTGETVLPLTINKASLEVRPKSVTLQEGSAAPQLGLDVMGLIGTDTITFAAEPSFKVIDKNGTETTLAAAVKTPGTYTIRWTNGTQNNFTGADNYQLNLVTDATLTVTAKPVVVPPVEAVPETTTKPSGSYKANQSMSYVPQVETIQVPISGEENTIYVDAHVEEDTATIDHVNMNHLETVIGDDVNTGTVIVDFSKADTEAVITTVVLPAAVVQEISDMAEAEDNDTEALHIIFPNGASIEFDALALKEKTSQAEGKDITISMVPYESVTHLTDAQIAAVGDREAYAILVTSGGEIISDLGGEVILQASYTLKPGETAEGLVVSFINEDGTLEPCETTYDPETETVTWKTNHLSLYVIGYKAP